MGGLLILFAFGVSSLLWVPFGSVYLWPVLFLAMAFGAIGFADDFLKLRRRSSQGLSGRLKLLFFQMTASFAVTLVFVELSPDALRYGVAMPSMKDVVLPLGLLYVPFAMLVMVGASNAVNLTDGLDGLAIVPVIITAMCFALIAYLVGNSFNLPITCKSTMSRAQANWR